MAGDKTDDFFQDALNESGVKVTDQNESTSTEKQELQASEKAGSTETTTSSTTESTSSETQEAVGNDKGATEAKPTTENPSLAAGESEKKSGIIDLNTESSNAGGNESSTKESTFNVSEMFGSEFSSVDEVIEQLNYAYDLQAKVTELESKKPTYANEFVEKLDEYVRNGGDPVYFTKIQSANIDSLSPIEALKLDLQWKHGITDQEAQTYIEDTYKLNEYEEGDINPKEVQLKIDSTAARKNLKDRQADNTLVDTKSKGLSEEEWNAKQQVVVQEAKKNDDIRMWDESKGWAPIIDKTIEDIKANGVILDLGNGKGFQYAYDKDDKYTEEFIGKVDQALYDSGLSRADNPKLAKDIAENLFFLENKISIMNAYAEQIRSNSDEANFVKSNNPSALNRGNVRTSESAPAKSTEEQMSGIWGK